MNQDRTPEDIYIIIEFLLCTVVMIMSVFRQTTIVSSAFYMMFIIELIILFKLSVMGLFYNDNCFKILIIISVIALINIAVNCVINHGNFGFMYLKKYIMFISTLLFLYMSIYLPVTKRVVKAIGFCVGAAITCYILVFFLQPARAFWFNDRVSNYLTFGMQNPNKTGLFLEALFVYAVVFISISEKRIVKIIWGLTLPILTYFIWLSQARNALISIFLFVALVFFELVKRKKQINKLMIFVLVSFPGIFAYIYMKIIHSDRISKIFGFLISEGKKIDSRYLVWTSSIQSFSNNPIFGAYYEISGGTGQSQCLNTHIDVLASYGVFIFILFIVFLYSVCKKHNDNISNTKQMVSFIGFISILFGGIGEAALVAGGTGLSVLAFGCLVLANYQDNSLGTEELYDGGKLEYQAK